MRFGCLFLPLTDPSEARYAEIARKLLEVGGWIMPQFDYGVPFWGKPPLAFWLTAVSMHLFGITAFAARLPSFVLSLGIVWIVWRWVARVRGHDLALLTAAILMTLPIFYVGVGVVTTDTYLLFGCTLCMISTWNAVARGEARSLYFAAIGLAIGVMSKGLVAAAVTLPPILLWLAVDRDRLRRMLAVPWFRAGCLFLLLSVPWFIAAEHVSPGFLHYFFVGEHFDRFLVPNWSGDRYGVTHSHMRGTIWLYLLGAGLPWSLLLLKSRPLWTLVHAPATNSTDGMADANADGWLLYLASWAIMPALLFTFAPSILSSYVLPGLPAFAGLLAECARIAVIGQSTRSRWLPTVVASAIAVPALLLGVAAFGFSGRIFENTEKQLVAAYENARTSTDDPLLFWVRRAPSAEFYTEGAATLVKSSADLCIELSRHQRSFLAVPAGMRATIPQATMQRLQGVYQDPDYDLYRYVRPETSAANATGNGAPPC